MDPVQAISVDNPAWFNVVVIATTLYPFLAPAFRRSHPDALALVIFPVALSAAVSLRGTAMITGALSTMGHGHLAASAGGAEVQFPLVLGCASAALTAILLLVAERKSAQLAYVPSALTKAVLAALVIVIVLDVVTIQWAARPGAVYSTTLDSFVVVVSWASAAVACLSAAAIFVRPAVRAATGRRTSLLVGAAIVPVIIGIVIGIVAQQLLKIGSAAI